jgi:uncharacterized protein (TIGR03000 family)
MMKFGTVAAIACCLTLSLWTKPAQAQLRDGNRGGIFARGSRGENRGIFRGGYYGGEEGTNGTVGSRRLFRNRMLGNNRRFGSYEAGYVPVANLGAIAGPTFVYGSDMSATTTVGNVANTPNVQSRRSLYSPPETRNQATIQVLVPDAKAQVIFDDTKTEETGTDRLFTSPALNPGKTYTYTIKAKWMDKDEEVVRTADIRVQAGRATLVDFRGKGDIRELKGPTQQ